MPSLIPGYEYDIFISYRHKDNQYDGWVTEFVANLRKELEATFKDDISIYFDENPHDGLLETHDVNKSLEGKLRCLVFIPILSQTYCDPKSFAWQYELCTFQQFSNQDSYGHHIKLNNGNVASRILPIRIHDLDIHDKQLFENETGGHIRAIDFIFKSTGVNRPLKPDDHRSENSNHYFYRDQINKVANSVKELVFAMVGNVTLPHSIASTPNYKIAKRRSKLISIALSIILLTVLSFVTFYFFSSNNTEQANKSIAVLPFVNMSNDPEQEFMSDGISEEIINRLVQRSDLKVIGRTSSFQFKGKNEDLRKIGALLDVTTVLEGSIRINNDQIRVTAQLISVNDGVHIWSGSYDRVMSDIFNLQDEIATAVVEELKAILLPKPLAEKDKEWKKEAYTLYLQGLYFHNRGSREDLKIAKEYFLRCVKIDSQQAIVWAYLVGVADEFDERKKFGEIAYGLDSTLGEAQAIRIAELLDNLQFNHADNILRNTLKRDNFSPKVLRNLGESSSRLGHYEEGIQMVLRAVDLDPFQTWSYLALGQVYMANGNFKEAVTAYEKLMELTGYDQTWYPRLFDAYLYNGEIQRAIEITKRHKNPRPTTHAYYSFATNYALRNFEKADSVLIAIDEKYSDQYPMWMASLYASRNEHDNTFHWLNRAVEKRDSDLRELLAIPDFIPLRKDPRFKALTKKLGFPD